MKIQGVEGQKGQPHLAQKAPGASGAETTTGTLYVSKPFRSGTSKKMRALISFVHARAILILRMQHRGRMNSVYAELSTPQSWRLPCLNVTYCAGILYAVLDIAVLACSAELCAIVRATWLSHRTRFRHHVLPRCQDTRDLGCCACPYGRTLRPFRKVGQEWMDTVLLVWSDHPARTSNHHTVFCNRVDIQQVRFCQAFISSKSQNLLILIPDVGPGCSLDFSLCIPSS